MKPATHKDRKDSGFTILELSIVLVIIGLIVGGIMVGRDLIRSACAASPETGTPCRLG